jgi:hypothetical protein
MGGNRFDCRVGKTPVGNERVPLGGERMTSVGNERTTIRVDKFPYPQ